MRAYVAGPLFDEGERWWIERIDALVASVGFTTFLPHRDNPVKTADNVREIFENDRRGIDTAAVVVASLNGLTTDDGTAWEIGYAFGRGIPVIGIHTDWRRRFDDEVVNLMIEQSIDALVRSEDDLRATLVAFIASLGANRGARSGCQTPSHGSVARCPIGARHRSGLGAGRRDRLLRVADLHRHDLLADPGGPRRAAVLGLLTLYLKLKLPKD